MSLSEIFDSGVANTFTSTAFGKKKIKLYELKAHQVKDLVLEMLYWVNNSWKIKKNSYQKLKKKFDKLFLTKIKNIDAQCNYKNVSATYSLTFLRKNPWFLK